MMIVRGSNARGFTPHAGVIKAGGRDDFHVVRNPSPLFVSNQISLKNRNGENRTTWKSSLPGEQCGLASLPDRPPTFNRTLCSGVVKRRSLETLDGSNDTDEVSAKTGD